MKKDLSKSEDYASPPYKRNHFFLDSMGPGWGLGYGEIFVFTRDGVVSHDFMNIYAYF